MLPRQLGGVLQNSSRQTVQQSNNHGVENMLQEFKDFALKGNVIDLAVAVIMATTFGGVIKSMVNDVLMPIIGIIAGKPSFDDIKISSIEIGKFLTEVVNFLIVAAALFLLIKALNAMMKTAMKGSDEEAMKDGLKDAMKE